MPTDDRLARAEWQCCASAPGEPSVASAAPVLADFDAQWYSATVPGTAAAAVQAAGGPIEGRDFDAQDWWYRCRFAAPAGPHRLTLAGLATIADGWLDGQHVVHSENMFLAHTVDLDLVDREEHELVLRFVSLTPSLAVRRPRPRWKVRRLPSQNLRWVRTTLLGRLIGWPATPAAVGPWKPITLVPLDPARATELVSRRLVTHADGELDASIELSAPPTAVSLIIGSHRAALTIDGNRVTGRFTVPDVTPWWPHTHGTPARYAAALEVDGVRIELGYVAFRGLAVDTSDNGFTLSVNGVDVFCRGAYWMPIDPVSMVDSADGLRSALTQFRDAGLNMVRIGGETTYPDDDFLDLCDELGLLIWHDCMFAFVDVPDDPELNASIEQELRQQFERLQSHPSVAVISGGSEIEQQAAMVGIAIDRASNPVFIDRITDLIAELLPGTPFVTSTPSGGDLPIEPRSGVAHYYGVGAYLRDPDDARRAGVRFAAECLAFATPPDRQTIDATFGGSAVAGHDPRWKAAVYRDAGASWDFEDVVTHYVRRLFRVDPLQVRYADPERYLDLARAAVVELFTTTLSEWRRPASPCAGALVFYYRDLVSGAGLGIVDSTGRPKATWYAMSHVCAPVTVLLTDEGLNGLDSHLLNDTGDPIPVVLSVELIANGETRVELVQRELTLAAHSAQSIGLNGLFEGFRDLSYAHRFGPSAFDVVVVALATTSGEVMGQQVFLPNGVARPVEADLGLTAKAVRGDSNWSVTISSRRFAQWVSIDVAGFVASDNWFHLAPGQTRTVVLTPDGSKEKPRGEVRALNCSVPVRLTVIEPA